ncbi:MAG: phage Gp37/Gp68 family protein [Desulfosporosinus sp.]|nr:phage Gp37/Gp68 family protein [Desulfosporosinus sp.]
MASITPIEWTEASWNPVTGCTKISDGCKNCYACTMAKRLLAMHNPRYTNGFNVTLHNDLLDLPLKWKKPRKIFVNSMSDLFHESIPTEFIEKVFFTMQRASWHTFQVLTKRAERLTELSLL